MIPEELFKRRHFGTPGSFFLITANYVVLALATQFWALCTQIDWYFWAVLGLLALYNAYKIYKAREEYDKVSIIAYAIGIVGMAVMFWAFRTAAHRC